MASEKRKKQIREAMVRYRVNHPDRVAVALAKNRERARRNYAADPEAARAARRAWVQDNPEKYLVSCAKCRAKKDGIEFSISAEDIIIPKRCPYLSIPLALFGDANTSPSLDRIDNTLGYVRGNVEVISQKANRGKNNLTPTELRAMARGYIMRFGG